MENKLERLVNEGIISKAESSEWASLKVAVQKENNKIRFCIDLKYTWISRVEVDQYPLPRVGDMFSNLTGGKLFIVIDLIEA